MSKNIRRSGCVLKRSAKAKSLFKKRRSHRLSGIPPLLPNNLQLDFSNSQAEKREYRIRIEPGTEHAYERFSKKPFERFLRNILSKKNMDATTTKNNKPQFILVKEDIRKMGGVKNVQIPVRQSSDHHCIVKQNSESANEFSRMHSSKISEILQNKECAPFYVDCPRYDKFRRLLAQAKQDNSDELAVVTEDMRHCYTLTSKDLDEFDRVQHMRRKLHLKPLKAWHLDNLFNKWEFESYKKMHNLYLKRLHMPVGYQNEKNPKCAVCFEPKSENIDMFTSCSRCQIKVHAGCYAAPQNGEKWKCFTCSMKLDEMQSCALCPVKGGAMKSTIDSKFCHVTCALYIPEIKFAHPDTVDDIDLKNLDEHRRTYRCAFCDTVDGYAVQCSVMSCNTMFHVMCCLRGGGSGNLQTLEDEKVSMLIFCEEHASQKAQLGLGEAVSKAMKKIDKKFVPPNENEQCCQFIKETQANLENIIDKDDASRNICIKKEELDAYFKIWLKRRERNQRSLLVKPEKVFVTESQFEKISPPEMFDQPMVNVSEETDKDNNTCLRGLVFQNVGADGRFFSLIQQRYEATCRLGYFYKEMCMMISRVSQITALYQKYKNKILTALALMISKMGNQHLGRQYDDLLHKSEIHCSLFDDVKACFPIFNATEPMPFVDTESATAMLLITQEEAYVEALNDLYEHIKKHIDTDDVQLLESFMKLSTAMLLRTTSTEDALHALSESTTALCRNKNLKRVYDVIVNEANTTSKKIKLSISSDDLEKRVECLRIFLIALVSMAPLSAIEEIATRKELQTDFIRMRNLPDLETQVEIADICSEVNKLESNINGQCMQLASDVESTMKICLLRLINVYISENEILRGHDLELLKKLVDTVESENIEILMDFLYAKKQYYPFSVIQI